MCGVACNANVAAARPLPEVSLNRRQLCNCEEIKSKAVTLLATCADTPKVNAKKLASLRSEEAVLTATDIVAAGLAASVAADLLEQLNRCAPCDWNQRSALAFC